ncbi:tetratricopeptide repeat protein, partial [Flavobacterium sp.]|uniref:tetratricopeptide repeat protein n=1 Tax=Flavobacterium sp. TaxID=239 RepID=UPI003C5BAD11
MKRLLLLLKTSFRFTSVFLVYFSIITSLHAQQFKDYTAEGLLSRKNTPEEAVTELKKLYKNAVGKKDTVQIIQSLISLSAADRAALNYGEAFSNAGDALFIAKEYKNPLLIAKAHEEFGVLNYLFKQDEEAGDHFKKAHFYYSKLKPKSPETLSLLFHSHYNLVLYNQRVKKIDVLQKHIDSCLSLSAKVPLGNSYALFLNEKKATVLEAENQHEKALSLLIETNKALESLKEKGQLDAQHSSFLTILYCRIATLLPHNNRLAEAKSYFEKSLAIPDYNGENTFYRSYVHLRYAELLFQLEEYKDAYSNLAKAKAINDTYLNPRNEDTQGFLTIKNRYSDQLRKKNDLLYTQNLEITKQTQAIFRFRIFFFVVVLLGIILALVVR